MFNVSLPLLRKERPGAMYYIYDVSGAGDRYRERRAEGTMSIG